MFFIDHAVEVAHIVKLHLSVSYADEGAPIFLFLALIQQVVQAHAREPCGLDAVEGGWIAALLQVSENGRAHVENVAPFLFK